ncbi:Uncharacterised protein [Shigella sonnei]|nr:Uncharacterised protein [Shigella sonnei]
MLTENIQGDAFRDPGGGPASGSVPGRARWLEGIFVEATLCIPADKGDLCRVVCAGRDVAR